jgi:tripartite-type tricarboxylate transporter receptor subunit TctC
MIGSRIAGLPRRLLLGAPLLALPRRARAAWPDRPIRLLIPYGGGGQTDVVARILAEAMSHALGQQMLPDNRPGASGVVAAEATLQAPADGYTVLVANRSSEAVSQALRPTISYRQEEALTTIGLHAATANILLVHRSVPAATLPEFIRHVRAHPGRLSFASSGIGATTHLSMELLMEKAGLEMVHIPYRQSTQGMTDLLAGRVQARALGLPEAEPVRSDPSIRALGVTSRDRAANWPEVPAIGETIPGYEARNIFGLMARSGTPAEAVARLNQALNEALASPRLREAFARVGAEPMAANTPEDADTEGRRQAAIWLPLIRRLNLSAQ